MAKLSKFVQRNEALAEIAVPELSSSALLKVLEWVNFHSEHPEHDQEELDWDKKFLKVDTPVLFEIIEAANCLEIDELTELCSKNMEDFLGEHEQDLDTVCKEFEIPVDLSGM
ncbi:suppressor of kinetochore protein mutant [Boothiomyces sp. JEL0866]|nr:suppressor of kinetochore protein mutant [Boothiomyces sp. JEL0866]